MNKKTHLFVAIVLCLFFLFNIISAYAADLNLKDAFNGALLGEVAEKGGYNPDTDEESVNIMIGVVIQTFLSIIGVIFLILMIYAGYTWMTAHGDDQKVTKAKETITASIIGLVIVLGAYAVTFLVISKLSKSVLK